MSGERGTVRWTGKGGARHVFPGRISNYYGSNTAILAVHRSVDGPIGVGLSRDYRQGTDIAANQTQRTYLAASHARAVARIQAERRSAPPRPAGVLAGPDRQEHRVPQ